MDVMVLRRALMLDTGLKLVNYTTAKTNGTNSLCKTTIISSDSFRVYTSKNTAYPASKQLIGSTPFAVGKTYVLKGHLYTQSNNADIFIGFRNDNNTFQSALKFPQNASGHDTDFSYEFTVGQKYSYLSLCLLSSSASSFDATLSNLRAYEKTH